LAQDEDQSMKRSRFSEEPNNGILNARGRRFSSPSVPQAWCQCFFSKFARSVLRHIRVASKQELKERIMLGIKDVNRHPTWSYKLAEAA
ncbi:MAG: hypothetical protein JWQ49_2278, partial [Edaphobacter sp.]|nr:hypothetical protein [Edaphobacter sp.]